MIWVKMATILVAAFCMLLAAVRHREWRGGLLLLGCVFLSAAMNEPEGFFGGIFPLKEPELPAIVFFLVLGVVLAALNRGTTFLALRAIYVNRRFPLLVWGLCLVSFLPQLGTDKHVWATMLPPAYSTPEARELVEHGIEFLGYIFLLNWSILFLRDKWRILTRRVPSPHEHLLWKEQWVRVGYGGSRRNCYRLGNSGFCVKFYKPPEECVPGKMKASIRRDIGWRRFNKSRNSSSQEVHLYNRLRHRMSESVLSCLPLVCERVFHPKFGWGVLETYYTNPDGTAIIPYEFEIERQTPENREIIYAQANVLLEALASVRAPFYEPGNFHVRIGPDGSPSLKIVDFEPESKMLIPLEIFWPWYRCNKLQRKSVRYLAHIRARYGVRGKTLEWLAAERGFKTEFVEFVRLLVGNYSFNFKATTADGRHFFVKFGQGPALEKARIIDARIDCPLVGKMAFGGRVFPYGEWHCFAYDWIEGARSIRPQDMSPRQIRSLGEAYGRLSVALENVCIGEGNERPIHGDLHYDNIFFRGDDVIAFFDFEMMRRGLPTEDLVRIFIHRLERTRFWRARLNARIFAAFRELVRVCPYSRAEWIEAIVRAERIKRMSRLAKRRGRLLVQIENFLRSWFYYELRRCVG